MVEVLLTLLVASTVLLLALFLAWRKKRPVDKPKEIPGWNRPPSDPEAGDLNLVLSRFRGSLVDFLLEQHKGGSCPVAAFWWKKERVVSVCSPQAFKDTENLHKATST